MLIGVLADNLQGRIFVGALDISGGRLSGASLSYRFLPEI